MRISDLYGLKVFTSTGKHLGEIQEVIVNLEDKSIDRLLLIPYSELLKGNPRELLQKYSIKYDKVKSIGEVVIVTSSKK